MRRIVTGNDSEGRSIVVSDSTAPRTTEFKTLPGFSGTLLWATEPGAAINTSGTDTTPDITSFVPAPGGTRVLAMTFPPDAVRELPEFDGAAMGAEFYGAMPGLAELFQPSGIHTTPTFDYAVVIEGEMTLETDDSTLTPVGVGDVVVQNGTSHAWRNLTDKPAKILVVLIGAASTTEPR
jgi:mannose-6-phosphate isomerase-like protein (cupin superfamily)